MNKKNIQNFLSQYKVIALLTVIALIWLFFGSLTSGDFLTARNFSNLLRQMAITGMLASTMVFIIVLTEIDLSIDRLDQVGPHPPRGRRQGRRYLAAEKTHQGNVR